MPKNNSGNQDFTPNADGFDITGGTIPRTFTVTGSNMTATGGSGITFNFPTNASYNRLVGMDGNNTASFANNVGNYTAIAATGGTTGLTAASTRLQLITGTSGSTQTITLPNATTLVIGHTFEIRNDSVASITIQNATPTTLLVIPGGIDVLLTCTNVSTVAGEWATTIIGSQGIAPSEQFIINNATRTLTSQTGAQKIFGTPTNGALTVNPLSTYFFECVIYMTSMATNSGNGGFSIIGAGTATVASASWFAHGLDSTTQSAGLTLGGSFSTTQANTANIVAPATGTAAHYFIKGTFKTTQGGTIIPSVSLTNAAAAIVQPGTYFRCWKVSESSVNSFGAWT